MEVMSINDDLLTKHARTLRRKLSPAQTQRVEETTNRFGVFANDQMEKRWRTRERPAAHRPHRCPPPLADRLNNFTTEGASDSAKDIVTHVKRGRLGPIAVLKLVG